MDKHAYCIIAHKDDYVFKALLKTIDDSRNDIFVLADKKSKQFDIPQIQKICKKSEIIFIPQIKVYWGGFSLVEAEIALFEFARCHAMYSYFHLLSGADMCIKNQNYIHDFFAQNKGKLFIEGDWSSPCNEQILERIRYYYIQAGRSSLCQKLNTIGKFIQKTFRVNRLKKNQLAIKKGSQWVSITQEFVDYILNNKEQIFKLFRRTICSDEIFLQTLAYNSKFKEDLYNSSNVPNNMRYIDWMRGKPYTFNEQDYNEIKSSNALFARKFNYDSSNRLVDMILDYLNIEQSGEWM